MNEAEKQTLINYFKNSVVAQNLEQLLQIFKTEQGVLEYCLNPIQTRDLPDSEKCELVDLVTQALTELFEKFRHRKTGAEILEGIK